MRINQYISHNTKYSRKEADALVLAGRVNIGRQKALPTNKVEEGQKVFLDGELIRVKNQFTAIVYHKPKGELVSKKDDLGRKTIFDSLGSNFAHFLPVGRLDYASEGLLILCDHPKVIDALMRSTLVRTYLLKLNGEITKTMEESMQNGLKLEDATRGGHAESSISSMDFAPFHQFRIIKNTRNYSRIKVSLIEGKNRELRRFFAHFKREILDLKRVSYGFVHLDALPSGRVRFFTRSEYKALHHFLKYSDERV